jgi:Flp pilus assembly protein TadB
MLLRFGIFLHAAEEISAREIRPGVTEILPRHAEVLSGLAVATVIVAMVMAAMVTVVTMVVMVVMVVVLVVEQIVEKTSDETSRKTWQQTEHSAFSIVARGARACLMPTLRCLLTV